MKSIFWLSVLAVAAATAALKNTQSNNFDVLIKNGTVYDGTGSEGQHVDLAIRGDRIAGLGDFKNAKAKTVIDAKGLVVAPGFINMLSWSVASLIQDGRSQSEIREGVTTEIMGEGESMGPLNDELKKRMLQLQADIKFDIKWNTLAEYLRYLEGRGISCNVASFLGAATVREYVIGFEDKQPTPQQFDQMRQLVRQAMAEGALGIARHSCIRRRFSPRPKN
jgi:N-acyl-D-amino-acid deacylase